MILAQGISILSLFQIHSSLPFQSSKERATVRQAAHLANVFILFVLSLMVGGLYFSSGMNAFWLFIPLLVFSINLSEIQKIWLLSENEAKLNSLSVSSNRVISVVIKTASPFAGLYLGEVFGNFIGYFISLKKRVETKKLSLKTAFAIFRKNSRFCFFYTLYTLSILFTGEFLTWIVSEKFSVAIAGQFFFSLKLTFQSATLLGSVISMTILPRMMKGTDERRVLFKTLLRILIPGMVVSFIVSRLPWEVISDFIFGGGWAGIGEALKFLVILIPLKTFSGVFSYLMVGQGRTPFVSVFRLLQFALFLAISYFINLSYQEFLLFLVIFELATESLFLFLSRRVF